MAKCVKREIQPVPPPPPVVEYQLTLTEEEAQVLCAVFGGAARPSAPRGGLYNVMLGVHRALQAQLGGWEARKYSCGTWTFNCEPRNA